LLRPPTNDLSNQRSGAPADSPPPNVDPGFSDFIPDVNEAIPEPYLLCPYREVLKT